MKIVWVSTLLFVSAPGFAQDFGPSQLRLWARDRPRPVSLHKAFILAELMGAQTAKLASRPARPMSSLMRSIQRIARRSTLLLRMLILIGRRAFAARVGDGLRLQKPLHARCVRTLRFTRTKLA
jgi:hypothetical protein